MKNVFFRDFTTCQAVLLAGLIVFAVAAKPWLKHEMHAQLAPAAPIHQVEAVGTHKMQPNQALWKTSCVTALKGSQPMQVCAAWREKATDL